MSYDRRAEIELFDVSLPRGTDIIKLSIPPRQLVGAQTYSIINRRIVLYLDGVGLNPLSDRCKNEGMTIKAKREIILTHVGQSDIKYYSAPGMDPREDEYEPVKIFLRKRNK